MEFPRLGVEWELLLPAYTIAHGNAGSLTLEQGQGLNLRPHGYWLGLLTTEPQRALQGFLLLLIFKPCIYISLFFFK